MPDDVFSGGEDYTKSACPGWLTGEAGGFSDDPQGTEAEGATTAFFIRPKKVHRRVRWIDDDDNIISHYSQQ